MLILNPVRDELGKINSVLSKLKAQLLSFFFLCVNIKAKTKDHKIGESNHRHNLSGHLVLSWYSYILNHIHNIQTTVQLLLKNLQQREIDTIFLKWFRYVSKRLEALITISKPLRCSSAQIISTQHIS